MRSPKVRKAFFALCVFIMGCGGNGGSGSVEMGGAIQGKALTLSGVVTAFVGSASNPGSADGVGAAASFNGVSGIATDGTNIYVADTLNRTIRKIVISTGEVTTIAGSAGTIGSADGTGSAANFNSPTGITTDGATLYVTDSGSSSIRKIVISTGAVSTLAGTAGIVGASDGIGAEARFNTPTGITTDGSHLYVVDSGNRTIRKIIISTGEVTTLAGTAGVSGSADGTGSTASFYSIGSITTDGSSLYLTDLTANTIRKVVISTGAVSTLAGTAGFVGSIDSAEGAAGFVDPNGITTDGTFLYIPDFTVTNNMLTTLINVRKIQISNGTVTSIPMNSGLNDTTATFNAPFGVTTDGSRLFIVGYSQRSIYSVR